MDRVLKNKELKDTIKKVTTDLVGAVKSTMGPMGHNVGLKSIAGLPIIVNDGVTVSRAYKFEDEAENFIANILRTVSQNTDNLVNDGTTTSLCLTEAILMAGLNSDLSPIDINQGIQIATREVLKKLEENKVEDKELLKKVATISANNDKELGDIIAKAYETVGKDGHIAILDSKTDKTYFDYAPGMKYNSGYESPKFEDVSYDNCNVLLYEGSLNSTEELVPVLQEVAPGGEPVLIIADSFNPLAIEHILLMVANGAKISAVKSSGYGEEKFWNQEDIIYATDAKKVNEFYIGKAEKVYVDSESYSLVSSKDLSERIETLKEEQKTIDKHQKETYRERIARMSGGLGAIYVYDNSPIAIAEKKLRIEDAIGAVRASLKEGIIIGGGVTLYNISKSLIKDDFKSEGEQKGYGIIKKAITAPLITISENAGESGKFVMSQIDQGTDYKHYGYNAKTREFGNMLQMGIIDPIMVTKTALTSASSVSEKILTMNYIIY